MSTACSPRRVSRGARPGFTLVEAVMAMAVMAVLLMGMTGALTMSISAADRGQDQNARMVSALELADRMAADIADAKAITERTDTAITVTVPDRDEDGWDEEIRYWYDSGTSRIIRECNTEPQVFAAPVAGLTLRYAVRTPAEPGESAETIIAEHAPLSLTPASFAVDGNTACSQLVAPVFDDDVIEWSITRIRVSMAMNGLLNHGRIRIQVCRANWNSYGPVLAETVINEASLPLLNLAELLGWTEFSFPKITGLAPGDMIAIVIREEGTTSGPVANVQYHGSGTRPYNTWMLTSNNGGATWSSPTDSADLRFQVYGTRTRK